MESENHVSNVSKKYRIFLTLMMCIAYFLFAFNNYQTGQSFTDFEHIYGQSFTVISYANTIRAFSYAIGALNGFIINAVNKQLVIMVYFILEGSTQIIVSYLKYVEVLYLDYAINGFVAGALELITNVWTVEMWGRECGPYVQAVHWGGSIAAILTPQIFAPYTMDPKHPDTSRIEIPYIILGCISIGFGLFMGSLYFYEKYVPREVKRNHVIDTKESRVMQKFREANAIVIAELRPSIPKHIVVVLCSFMVAIALTLQWSQFNYIITYVEESDLHIQKEVATKMNQVLAAALLASRGFMTFFARLPFVTPKIINFGCYLLLLAAEILYLIFTNTNETGVWVANVIYGLGLGPVMAGAYQLAEECLSLTDLMGVLFIFMSGFVTAITPIIMGKFMDTKPLTLVYVNLFFIGSALVIIIILYIISRLYIKKPDKNNDNNNNGIALEAFTPKRTSIIINSQL